MSPSAVRCTRSAKPQRFARVLGRPESGALMVELEERRARSSRFSHYYLERIPAQFGRAYVFSKFAAEGAEVYAVNLGGDDTPASCECMGHLRHGHKTACKHLAAARALVAAGKLS